MTFKLPDKDKLCHHTGFEKTCLGLVAGGTCQRWRALPGKDVFTGEAREQWGCIDDLVLQLQGEAMRENSGTHAAVTGFREMIFNPHYRARPLSAPPTIEAIEDQT